MSADPRRRYADDDLVIVFDIDATILDMRNLVRHVLLKCDRRHGARFFYGLRIEDIDVLDNRVEPLRHRQGINRFSISWEIDLRRRMFERLEAGDYEVNFYNLPDLERRRTAPRQEKRPRSALTHRHAMSVGQGG